MLEALLKRLVRFGGKYSSKSRAPAISAHLTQYPKRPKGLRSKLALRAIGAAFAAVMALAVSEARAAGALLGPMCVDGVTVQEHRDREQLQVDGKWIPITYRIDPRAANPRLVIFDRPIPSIAAPETCSQVIARMQAAGATLVLSGRPEDLRAEANRWEGAGGNRLAIAASALRVTLRSVESGSRPVAGGTIDFRGSKLWIENSAAILVQATGISGEFQVEAWDRRIQAARFTLTGGMTYVSDLRPRVVAGERGNVTVRLDLASGNARLWAGDLEGVPQLPASGNADLGTLRLTQASLRAQALQVVGRRGELSALFRRLSGNSAQALLPGERLTWTAQQPGLTIAELQAAAEEGSSGLELGSFDVRGLTLEAATASLHSASDSVVLEGQLSASFAVLRRDRLTGTNLWTRPSSPGLTPIFAAGSLESVSLSIDGARAAPTLSGEIRANQIALEGIQLISPSRIAIPQTRLDAAIVIPIHIDLPAASGTVRFLVGPQTVAITGRLDRLFLDGRLTIPLSDVSESSLSVPRGNLRVAVGAAIAVSPVIAGARPNFLDTSLALTNMTDLRVAKTSTGTALLTAQAMVLAQPVFQIGENGTSSQATVSLNAEGAVDLAYDLGNRSLIFARGRLRARNTTFALTGQGPKRIDLGGTLITDPSVTLEDLQIEMDLIGPVQIQRGRLTNLSIAASRVERHRTGRRGLQFSGSLSRPVTLSSVDAGRVLIADRVLLGGGQLERFDLGLSDADIDVGDGVELNNATVDLRIDKVRSSLGPEPEPPVFENASLAASGRLHIDTPGFTINDSAGTRLSLAVSGPSDALFGRGRLDVGAFTGHGRGQTEIGFRCDGGSNLFVPLQYNFDVGQVGLDLEMRDGKVNGQGAAGIVLANMHSPGASCEQRQDRYVIAPAARGWTWGICSEWFRVYRCKWEWSTPEIAFSWSIQLAIRFSNMTLTLPSASLRLEDGKMRLCNNGFLPPPTNVVILGGYSPQIHTPVPLADRYANAVIAAGFEAPQSLLASGLMTGAGWLLSIASPLATICTK